MKKLLLLLWAGMLCVGCSAADLEKEIADLRAELDEQKEMIEALQANASILEVTAEEGEYTIWFTDGTEITLKDGKTPLITIGENGNWYINKVDSGKPSKGADGENGTDGSKVTIGENKNWFIDGEDTGISATVPATNSIVGVVDGDKEMTFVFADQTTISCPKGSGNGLVFAERPTKGYENFHVEVNYYAEDNDKTQSTIKQDGSKTYWDYGVIALPENYSTDPNSPTRLIILCQGTGERTGASTNPLGNHGWEYFLAKGYAVLDMNGMAPSWGQAMGFPVTDQHYCNKHVLQCYKKGYDYVMKKYNLHKEVFVMGISMGGGASTLIVQNEILPVIAQAAFCPALSVYKNNFMQPWGGTNQQRTIAGQYNFANWKSATLNQAYFLENYDKVVGYDNLMINTFGDAATKQQANENYNNDAEREAYCALSKYYPCPLKIWHATDDTVVAYRYSEFMVQMIKNAGGNATLRTMTSGGHVGGWNNAKGNVSDTDINGKTIKTSVPFYEAMMFIQRYE
ncbi:MAG: hypothetical protein IKA60_00120 [Rikenellaceae bacterium]|nr:hypothetical protein [Rikenellaceae bacterium]